MLRNDEFLYRLRTANPIETVMGAYVQTVRRGRNYVCSCPFHSEKLPPVRFLPILKASIALAAAQAEMLYLLL